MAGRVWAVTISWNSADVLADCLDSLMAEGDAVAGVTVVDNASTDGSAGLVRERYPTVRLIENKDNLGFAAAANQGIRASEGDYVLLVNPDISFKPGFVNALVAAVERDKKNGAAAPKLMRPAGSTIDSAGLVMRKDRKSVDRGRDKPDTGAYDTPCRVFGACGAAAMYRREMLEDAKTGDEYFDESFFAYKEDVDLAWRANLLGWKAVYEPMAVATHRRGWQESGRKAIPRFIRRHSHKNRYLTIIKNDDPVNFMLHLPSILYYESKLFVYSLVFEPFLFLAIVDAARLLPEAVGKRRRIMASRRTGRPEMRKLFE